MGSLTIARLNRPGTQSRATRYDLDQPARDRHQESAALPPGGHNFAPKSRSAYQKRATPPPTSGADNSKIS